MPHYTQFKRVILKAEHFESAGLLKYLPSSVSSVVNVDMHPNTKKCQLFRFSYEINSHLARIPTAGNSNNWNFCEKENSYNHKTLVYNVTSQFPKDKSC
jgi:hypothetical protein